MIHLCDIIAQRLRLEGKWRAIQDQMEIAEISDQRIAHADKFVILAAHAKAAMVALSYVFHVGSESVGIYWPRTLPANQQEFIAASQLDDTDPISEARAVLGCIAEALGVVQVEEKTA